LEAGTITIILQLVFLEGILSIDNAAVLGAMVLHLPTDEPIPWPRWMHIPGFIRHRFHMQRSSALKVGLLGAYAGRALMLLLAGTIITVQWVRVLGAVYLLYLGIEHLGGRYREQEIEHEIGIAVRRLGGFWSTVGATILADLAFSVDNVIAAVALSSELWVVLLGVAIGMVIMRFAATLFSRAIAWEPALETGAYLLLITIGVELLVKEYLHVHIGEQEQFLISISILILTVLFARVRLLRKLLIVARPVLMLAAGLTWALEYAKGVLLSPLRRRSLPRSDVREHLDRGI
jgi:tellurite resistance protein TerC